MSKDARGFVYVGGVKICRLHEGRIEVLDKNRVRCAKRGTDTVTVRASDFVQALSEMVVSE